MKPGRAETGETGGLGRPGQGQQAMPTMHGEWLACTWETGAARAGSMQREC